MTTEAHSSGAHGTSLVPSMSTLAREVLVRTMVRVRPSVQAADIPALRDAYGKMQARSENDNRGWIYWAEFHGYNRYDCWHHGRVAQTTFSYDLFLPWHRAYLLYWEETARAWNGNAILPWWDWTTALSHQEGIPASFRGPNKVLNSGPVPSGFRTNPSRTRRQPGAPSQLPSRQTVNNILALTSFVDFSNQLQDVHDMIHGWVGGDMGTIAASAFDPIFWSHHCMIDRIWYLWQLRHGVENVPPSYLERTLAPWDLKVKDVLDTRRLGYEYGSSRVIIPALDFRVTQLVQS